MKFLQVLLLFCIVACSHVLVVGLGTQSLRKAGGVSEGIATDVSGANVKQAGQSADDGPGGNDDDDDDTTDEESDDNDDAESTTTPPMSKEEAEAEATAKAEKKARDDAERAQVLAIAKVKDELDSSKREEATLEAKIQDAGDQSQFKEKLQSKVKTVANETESPKMARLLGDMWKDMRMFATPFYQEHLEQELQKARDRSSTLELEFHRLQAQRTARSDEMAIEEETKAERSGEAELKTLERGQNELEKKEESSKEVEAAAKLAERLEFLKDLKAKTPYSVFFLIVCGLFAVVMVLFIISYAPVTARIQQEVSQRRGSVNDAPHSLRRMAPDTLWSRLFLMHKNPAFAEDYELAFRGAVFALVVGGPLIFYNHPFISVHELVAKGYYNSAAVVYFVFTLYKSVGQTISFAWNGMVGTFFAVFVVWLLYGVYPVGVSEHLEGDAFWVGTITGCVFVLSFLWLNVGINTSIFALSTWVYFWMAFLEPTTDSFSHSFQIRLRGTAVNCLLQCTAGCAFAVLATLLPYPIWALEKAKKDATSINGLIGSIWHTFYEGFSQGAQGQEKLITIKKQLGELRSMIDDLQGKIDAAWWECLGLGRKQKTRLILTESRNAIYENYDIMRGALGCISEVPSSLRVEFMKLMEDNVANVVEHSTGLMQECVEIAADGVCDDEEAKSLKEKKQRIYEECETFTRDFQLAKKKVGVAGFSNELVDEHVFCFAVCASARIATTLADGILKDRDGTKKLKDDPIPFLFGIFDLSVMLSKDHLSFVGRNAASIFLAFAIGFQGYSNTIMQYNAEIAGVVCILLSKVIGSAMLRNLSQLQGVVLGSVIGQIIYSLFGWCAWWGTLTLCTAIFCWSYFTLFIYYNSKEYSTLGCLLAVFGLKNMLVSCTVTDFEANGAYKYIVSIVLAVSIMLGIDTIFASGRACDKATQTLADAFSKIQGAVNFNFDPKNRTTRFHKGGIMDSINGAQQLSGEADNEPRFYRTPFQTQLFLRAVTTARTLRFNATLLEYTAAEARRDGAPKVPAFLAVAGSPSLHRMIEMLSAKNSLMQQLLEVFSRDAEEFNELLLRPDIAKQLSANSVDDVAAVQKAFYNEGVRDCFRPQGKITFMDDDPVVMGCIVASSLAQMMGQLDQMQISILAASDTIGGI